MKIIQIVAAVILITGSGFNELNAQKLISTDAGFVYNTGNKSPGINISAFYHFSERIAAGIEMNRFVDHHPASGEEGSRLSAWDFDLNVHYNLPVTHTLFCYPLAGISHTSEREIDSKKDTVFTRFFSFNTGAGVFLKLKKVTPFVEYMYTWGKINQQFFLAGIGYEFEIKKK